MYYIYIIYIYFILYIYIIYLPIYLSIYLKPNKKKSLSLFLLRLQNGNVQCNTKLQIRIKYILILFVQSSGSLRKSQTKIASYHLEKQIFDLTLTIQREIFKVWLEEGLKFNNQCHESYFKMLLPQDCKTAVERKSSKSFVPSLKQNKTKKT